MGQDVDRPERTALALLTAGREVDPDLWVFETKTMDGHLALMRLPQQLSAFVLSAFGVLALALAAIGLYGVVSHGVSQRTHEIGIRMALGADGPRVVRLLVAGGLRLVLAGGVSGWCSRSSRHAAEGCCSKSTRSTR